MKREPVGGSVDQATAVAESIAITVESSVVARPETVVASGVGWEGIGGYVGGVVWLPGES